MKLLAWFFCLAGLLLAQEREGNFSIRFDPTAVLQTGAPIPFQITVHDANHNLLKDSRVTLQIETGNGTHVKVFPAPAADPIADPGVYTAKPVFDVPGEWKVYVEVHHANGHWDETSARAKQYNVPQ